MKSNGRVQLPGALCQTLDRPSQTPPRMPPLVKRLYTAKEAGVYLGYKSAWPVRELAWNGVLPYVQLGERRIAFDVQDLDRYIEVQKIREPVGVF